MTTGSSAHAIPSPDLIINAFASAAQIAGLLTAMSGAALLRLQQTRPGHTGRASRGLAVFGIVAVLSIVVNVWQYAHHVSQNSRRLEANLWRKPADWDRVFAAPTITSAALASRMASGEPLQLVDVREPEEFEVTHLPGAVNQRYADLLLGAGSLLKPIVPVVFMCDSGKRSGEVCEQRTRMGLPCQVLEGGIPQWVREERPMSTPVSGWRNRFLPLPRFARDTIYLDTPDVSDLVLSESAGFLDVRSPEEFARGHLPGAVNLPMRGMATDALTLALAQLPVQPWVVACYDNRSCFHARVLGLKLTRLGLDFQGRYTVPHEYPVPTTLAARGMWPRVQRVVSTAVDKAVEPLALALAWTSQHLGGLVPAMLLLLLLTRLPLAPLAAKSQRDRLTLRTLAEPSAQLRSQYADDPFRQQRAMQQLRRQHGLTPWRNLAVSLLQMGVFLICFAAVRAAAQWSDESFLWIELLREPDPFKALSLAIALTAGALCWRLLVDVPLHWGLRCALSALGAGVLGWMSLELSAAISLYLLASMALLWLQQSPWKERHRQLRTWWAVHTTRMRPKSLHALALEQCTQATPVGNKAWRQGQMRLAGMPVPPGWVWPHQDLLATPAELASDLLALGLDQTATYAVRSSGADEDTAAQSMAGLFRSELQVPFAEVPAAMQRVLASYTSELGTTHRGGVIVQRMVEAQYAGVLFTCDPGNAGGILIEWVAGLGESLASGRATPKAVRLGRLSGRLFDATAPCPIDLTPLVALARRIEDQFGRPQDIEWAFSKGQFFILQSRDIVVQPSKVAPADQITLTRSFVDQERTRLLQLMTFSESKPHTAVMVQTDLSADLPRPTPLSLSLMQRLRADGGSTDRAFERLGLGWQASPHGTSSVQTAFGQTLVLQAFAQSPPMGVLTSFSLSRGADAIESHFRQTFLPGHQEMIRWREVMDLTALTDAELIGTLQTWVREFVEVNYVEAEVINIAAEFYARAAAKGLARRGLDSKFLGLGARPVVAPTLRTHGHRAVHDWELSEPRFSEDPEAFERHFSASHGTAMPSAPPETQGTTGHKLLDSSITRAQHFAQLKDDAKHALLREWAQLRRVLQVLDQRLGWEGLVFYLEWAELTGLDDSNSEALREQARLRHAQARAFRSVDIGTSLSIQELEIRTDWFAPFTGLDSVADKPGVLRGLRVSGTQSVTAPVRVLRNTDDMAELREGEIAVVALADPAWLGSFGRAAGLVTEVGGWLAHLAILAREHNVAAVFAVPQALQQLRSGDVVTLETDGTVRVQSRAAALVTTPGPLADPAIGAIN